MFATGKGITREVMLVNLGMETSGICNASGDGAGSCGERAGEERAPSFALATLKIAV